MKRRIVASIELVLGAILLVAGGIGVYCAVTPRIMMFWSDGTVTRFLVAGVVAMVAGFVAAVLAIITIAKS